MVQVPPPIHGASLCNQSLVESKLLNSNFEIKVHPLSFVQSIKEIGSITIKKLWKSVIYTLELIRILISFRPHLVYFTIAPSGGAFYRDTLFVFVLKLFGQKIIFHLHGLGIKGATNKSAINRILYNFVFKNSNVVCISKLQLKDVEHLQIKEFFVVPNGLRVDADSEITPPNSLKNQILFLSNYVRTKGIFEFIDAIKELSLRRSDFTARMVGANVDVSSDEIKQYVDQHGLNDKISVEGPAYKEEKIKAFRDCYFFVFPTYYPFELFPGVIQEAMQCGKPVISTYHGAISDIVEDGVTGYLVPPQNITELAKKIELMLDHPETARTMGEKARAKFYNHYTLAHFEQGMKKVFKSLML